MTIDERIESLVQSTKSLHASCEKLHAIVIEQNHALIADALRENKRAARLRRAILNGIHEFLEGLEDGGTSPEKP